MNRFLFPSQRMLATVCLAVLVTGCKVGPDYHKPEAATPAQWLSAAVQTSDKTAIDQEWWKHFHDTALDTLIGKATAGNFDLKIAQARIMEARATRSASTSALLPTGDMSANGTREANRIAIGNVPFPGIKAPFDIFQAGFDASWELDVFGGRRRDVEAATADLRSEEASRDAARVSLFAEVARTYISIREYQAQLAIASDAMHADQNILAIAQERVRAGTSPGLDVTQAKAQLDQAQAEQPYYQSLLAQAQFAMDVLVGEQPGYTQQLLAAAAPIPASEADLVPAAPVNVIANRPDIRMAERRLAAATARQGVATAELFPDISLSAFLGLLSSQTETLVQGGSRSWSGSGNFVWNILNYPKIKADIDLSNAQQQEALLTYQKSVVSALSDVEQSLTAYGKESEYRTQLDNTARENRHALDIAQMRYKKGVTSFIEVLDAERTLYASQSQAEAADALAAQDLVAVYKSLGGGWKQPVATPASPETVPSQPPAAPAAH